MDSQWRAQPRFRVPGSGSRQSLAKILVIVNVVAFVLQMILESTAPAIVDNLLALSREGIASGYFWQPVTYMFLHGGLFHLLANCLVIYFAGRNVEMLLGPKPMLLIYFAGGILGGLLQLVEPGGLVIGASAGGYALLIAFTTLLPELPITLLLFFVIPVRMRAKYLGWSAVGSSIIFQVFGIFPGLGHLAHIGGALVGYLITRKLTSGNPFAIGQEFRSAPTPPSHPGGRKSTQSTKDFISQEIDPILDKIARDGMHSLTREEKRILEQGREKIQRKTSLQ